MKTEQKLPESVTYDMRLSDSYLRREGYEEQLQSVDLEAVIHIFDYRMTLDEVYRYLSNNVLPERLIEYPGDLLDYALTANTLTYVQKAGNETDGGMYPLPERITSEADLFRLLMERGVFVDLFRNKEVCDMTVAEFSRDKMFFYQSRIS